MVSDANLLLGSLVSFLEMGEKGSIVTWQHDIRPQRPLHQVTLTNGT